MLLADLHSELLVVLKLIKEHVTLCFVGQLRELLARLDDGVRSFEALNGECVLLFNLIFFSLGFLMVIMLFVRGNI